jgi:hypothetical protein
MVKYGEVPSHALTKPDQRRSFAAQVAMAAQF